MILPYLGYGCLLISSSTDSNLLKLQQLQNKVLKCAHKISRYYSTRELHKVCRILTVHDRIKYNQLKFIHGYFLVGNPLFSPRENNVRWTRSVSDGKLALPFQKVVVFRKSILYNGVKEWNALPVELKSLQSLPSFKSQSQ